MSPATPYRSYNAETQRANREVSQRVRKQRRKARVAVTYHQPTRAERSEQHKVRMHMKAVREVQIGFEPVENVRISKAYTAIRASLHMQNPMISPMQSHNEAIRTLCRQLPPLRRDYFQLRPDTSKQATVPGYCDPTFTKAARRVIREEMARAA